MDKNEFTLLVMDTLAGDGSVVKEATKQPNLPGVKQVNLPNVNERTRDKLRRYYQGGKKMVVDTAKKHGPGFGVGAGTVLTAALIRRLLQGSSKAGSFLDVAVDADNELEEVDLISSIREKIAENKAQGTYGASYNTNAQEYRDAASDASLSRRVRSAVRTKYRKYAPKVRAFGRRHGPGAAVGAGAILTPLLISKIVSAIRDKKKKK